MKSAALALSLAVPALRPPVAVLAPLAPAVVAPFRALAVPVAPQAAGLPPLAYPAGPNLGVPVYYRATFARALEANAPLVAAAAPADADEVRLSRFFEHEHAWEVEASVRRAGAEAARLRVFVGKHDGRVAVVPAK